MTEQEILRKLLDEHFDELSERQQGAFESMVGRPLSDPQRRWVYGVAERFGICVAPSENLFSQLPEKKRREHLEQVRTQLPWERPGYVEATRPSGR